MDDEKLTRILNNYLEFKFRKEQNILTLTCKKGEIPCNDELLKKGVDIYKNYLLDNKPLIVIIDVRLMETINTSYVWNKVGKIFAEIEPIAAEKVICGSVLLNNKLIKLMINSLLQVYPAKRPFNISGNYEEAMKFIKSVKTKK